MARIDAFLELGRQQGCSDIHLAVGMPPMIRLHGVLEAIKYRQLTAEEMIELVSEILSKDQLKKFENGQDLARPAAGFVSTCFTRSPVSVVYFG